MPVKPWYCPGFAMSKVMSARNHWYLKPTPNVPLMVRSAAVLVTGLGPVTLPTLFKR